MTKNMAILDENGYVINIAIFNDDEKETSTKITYTDNNSAIIGGDYFDGYFYPPKPYNSWTRNQGKWEAPTPYPTNGGIYKWVEEDLNWQLIESEV